MDLINEFVPYEQALTLKELGFNERCLATYDINFDTSLVFNRKYANYSNDAMKYVFNAPLYSQAFRWFREKYDLTWEHQFDDSNISLYVGEITYPDNNLDFFKIIEVEYNGYNKAYKEAELECLKKLIEITKQK
jgi:hypothetical protein